MTRIASVLFAVFGTSLALSFLAFAAGHRLDERSAELGSRQGVALAGGLNIDCNDHGMPPQCGLVIVDTTRTPALRVRHRHVGSGRDVEPDIGDTWLVTFTWLTLSTSSCPCTTTELTATASVDWTGSTWNPTCLSGCNGTSGPIWQVRACGGADCGTLASEYILLFDVDTIRLICAGAQAILYAVEFTSIDLDDGDVFTRSPCEETLAVSPINEPYYTVDYGTFECEFDCNFVTTAPIVTIEYQ